MSAVTVWLTTAEIEARVSHRCDVCRTPLSDPASIKRGIGPECWGRVKAGTVYAVMHNGRLKCPKCRGRILGGACRRCDLRFSRYVKAN